MRISSKDFLQIKAEAQNLGFFQINAIPCEQPSHFYHYQKWLDQRLYGDMHYLARPDAVEKRSDPRLLLPQCKSIISLAFPYPITVFGNDVPANFGRISTYAVSPDYHQQINELLEKLAWIIQKQLGYPFLYRCCVDSSPILEKDLAVSAGLGWIGKNTCLISPRIGSFFFLAEILTELEIDCTSTPMSDHCGNCTRCIDACPAKCIMPNRTLIADHCISYLTIEHKKIIPAELRPNMGAWIFGCDICQLVCPWNKKFAKFNRSRSMRDTNNLGNSIDLRSELFLTDDGFKQKYQNFPILRLGRNRFVRNIAVALGNQKATSNFDLIFSALEHEKDPLVRTHLYWALGQSDHILASTHIKEFLKSEIDPLARDEICLVLIKKPGSDLEPGG